MDVTNVRNLLLAATGSLFILGGCASFGGSEDRLIREFASSVCAKVPRAEVKIKPFRMKVEFDLAGLLEDLRVRGKRTWLDRILDTALKADGCEIAVFDVAKALVDRGDYRDRGHDARVDKVQGLRAAVSAMSSGHVAAFLVREVPRVNGGLACDEFAELLEDALSGHRGDVVTRLAPYIHRPISSHCYERISRLVLRGHTADAMSSLIGAKPRY